MSEREILAKLIEKVPAYKMPYVIGYIQGLLADEALDDLFCRKLGEDTEPEPDDDELIPEAEVMRICGVKPDEV